MVRAPQSQDVRNNGVGAMPVTGAPERARVSKLNGLFYFKYQVE
jgi:hypothetical protein